MARMNEGLREQARLLDIRRKNQAITNAGMEVVGQDAQGRLRAIGRMHPQSSTQSGSSPDAINKALANINPRQAGRALSNSSFAQNATSASDAPINQAIAGAAPGQAAVLGQLLNANTGATTRNLGFAGSAIDRSQRANQPGAERIRDIAAAQNLEDSLLGRKLRNRRR